MTELLTAAQMRAIETAAIASGQVTGLELMERAGQGVVEAIFEEWPELKATSHRAVVLCGPGNNGGDGFVVARLLKGRGWEVEVFLYGEAERLPPGARVNYELWVGLGEVRPLFASTGADNPLPGRCALLVDALFGIGLTRPIDLPLLGLQVSPEAGQDRRVVAVDVPSGLCSDSGKQIGHEVIVADLTVTFHGAKRGHLLADGPALCGRLVTKGIGLAPLPSTVLAERGRAGWLRWPPGALSPVHDADCRLLTGVAALSKGSSGHKYVHGHALILSGPSGHGGAARLAARGALRIGAGLVTLGCPPDAIPENAARLDAIMLREVADADALAGVLTDTRIKALCLGPAMGVERAAELLPVAVRAAHAPCTVLDADALTALSQDPALFALLHDRCILTPHAGEFARLFPDIAAKLAEPATKGPAWSKVDATREAAARAGCVVLYKGPDTVIASPGGQAAINSAAYDRAAPWLATAGSGDVLAGFITGLLARGFAPSDAACTGAWLHVEAARSFGPGLIAEDLPEELPKVFRALGL